MNNLLQVITESSQFLEKFCKDKAEAQKLVRAGDAPGDASLDVTELAAYTAMASVILNLDEAITKE